MVDNRLLKDDDRKILIEEYWNRLVDPVELIYINTRDSYCQYCSIIKQLYTELSELTDKIIFKEHYFEDQDYIKAKYNVNYAPSTVLKGKNKGLIKFYGIPAGQEFPSFIETLVILSNGSHGLSKDLVDNIQRIRKPVNIKVFVTPSCPYCPKMVFTSFQFAFINEYIEAEAWEAMEFSTVAEKYDVMAVPKVVINDKVEWEGLVPPEYLLQRIIHALK